MQRLKSLICDEDGAEILEFAAASTIFFALVCGILEFALVIYTGNMVAVAAQQGSRYAMVRGSDWTSACATASSYGCKATSDNVKNYVVSQLHPGINLQTSNVTVTWLTTSAAGTACSQYSQGCQVEVTVSYTFPLKVPIFSANIPLSSTSIETIQD